MTRKKQIMLSITVSGPSWMTKEMAKREVRSLINDQAFYGSRRNFFSWDEIGNSNFRLRKIS